MKKYFLRFLSLLTSLLFLISSNNILAAPENGEMEKVFAKVGDDVITLEEYRLALVSESRDRFYHGKPAEGQLEEFQREVAEQMVTNVLLVTDAQRQGIKHDEQILEQKLNRYRARAKRNNQEIDEQSAPWQNLRKKLIEEQLVKQLEASVRARVSSPEEEVLKDYYRANLEKFTEPPRFHLSNILLQVDPSAGAAAWEAAKVEAEDITKRIREGADFGEMATLHSSDASAENGGDMGYLHQGMLTADVQEKVEALQVGEITDPLIVLEGVVILKLQAKDPGGVQEFGVIRKRANELWSAEQKNIIWQGYVENLRNSTVVEMNEQYLTPTGQSATGN